ncbi:transporter substrate-binding domain-containing protein [Diaphorobacter aerolatus]|uniref:Transporter substrate-binding domain-containing protein n=1 Tax=Diaphorobacter aerolatus TaxID=1288495 RepID=A0A7H0GJ29_9BURK|nr:transporter substrate-binding domain-containing protein [Diaphorobacter aerolatus]QNP48295.1 transporter substrate-binding domain-containing protein [Diaphorobacter aerolatus]
MTQVSNKDPLRIGVLFSQTGATSRIGRSQLQGTLLGIEEVNDAGGVDGREVVPVIYDAQSDPRVYATLAERLILEDRVNTIFGCYMSSSRKAVIPIIERWNKLLFYPTLYEGFEFSNNLIYTGAAPNQNSVQLAEYMTANFGARAYLIGSDYIYPWESNRIMKELIQQRPNSELLGERYVKLDATEIDFEPILMDIKARQPDFIFSTIVGDSTASLYQAYANAGLDPTRMPIASLTTSEAEISQMLPGAAAGHFTAAPYFQSIRSDVNQRCLERFRRRFGHGCMPNLCWEAAYFQIHLFANAFRLAGSDEINLLLPHLLGSEFTAPQGRVRIDERNHHTCLYPRVGRVDVNGQFVIMREATRAVHPDPYLVTHSLGDWTVKLPNLINDAQEGP